MFSAEVRAMLAEVITSWQVIAVTVVLVIYITIVRSVARISYRRRPPSSMPKVRGSKSSSADSGPAPGPDDSDELILEENTDD